MNIYLFLIIIVFSINFVYGTTDMKTAAVVVGNKLSDAFNTQALLYSMGAMIGGISEDWLLDGGRGDIPFPLAPVSALHSVMTLFPGHQRLAGTSISNKLTLTKGWMLVIRILPTLPLLASIAMEGLIVGSLLSVASFSHLVASLYRASAYKPAIVYKTKKYGMFNLLPADNHKWIKKERDDERLSQPAGAWKYTSTISAIYKADAGGIRYGRTQFQEDFYEQVNRTMEAILLSISGIFWFAGVLGWIWIDDAKHDWWLGVAGLVWPALCLWIEKFFGYPTLACGDEALEAVTTVRFLLGWLTQDFDKALAEVAEHVLREQSAGIAKMYGMVMLDNVNAHTDGGMSPYTSNAMGLTANSWVLEVLKAFAQKDAQVYSWCVNCETLGGVPLAMSSVLELSAGIISYGGASCNCHPTLSNKELIGLNGLTGTGARILACGACTCAASQLYNNQVKLLEQHGWWLLQWAVCIELDVHKIKVPSVLTAIAEGGLMKALQLYGPTSKIAIARIMNAAMSNNDFLGGIVDSVSSQIGAADKLILTADGIGFSTTLGTYLIPQGCGRTAYSIPTNKQVELALTGALQIADFSRRHSQRQLSAPE
jgi:hypothetical protein